AVFGGLMLVFKRWAVLLAVASLDSTIYLLHSWFRGSLKDRWWSTPLGLWTVLTLVALAGAVWSWGRYRAASPEERAVARVPRQGEKVILGALSVIGLVIIVSCLLRGVLLQPPWKELLAVWVVAWAGALCTLFADSASRLALPSESVMLGALVCA